MKTTLFTVTLLLWLVTLIPSGYSQSRRHFTNQEKQAFVYILSGQGVSIYSARKNGGLKLVPHDYLDVGKYPRYLLATPNGRALYVASDADSNDYHSGLIYEFLIRESGSLTRLGAIEAGSVPIPLTMDSSGSFLYCASMEAKKHQGLVYQYRVGADKSLSPLKPPLVNLGAIFAHSLIMHPSGNYLYALTNGNSICFHISHRGVLLRSPTAPTQLDAKEIAIEPSGKYAYLLQKDAVISVADVAALTGNLLNPRPVAHVLRGAYNMSINSQRHVLQITNLTETVGGSISEFRIAPDGTLKPSIPPTFPAFKAYTRLAPDPRGQFAYVIRSK